MKTIKRKSGIASAFLTELLLAVRTRAQSFTVFDVKQHWNRALTLTNINTNTKVSSVTVWLKTRGTCTQTFTYDITLPSPLPGRSPSAPMASVDRYGMVLDPSKRSVPGFAVSGDGGVDP